MENNFFTEPTFPFDYAGIRVYSRERAECLTCGESVGQGVIVWLNHCCVCVWEERESKFHMKEKSIVRENLMTEPGYAPYCGNNIARHLPSGCSNPRTKWNGEQFVCPCCGWISQFPKEFIDRYKAKWLTTPIN